MKIEILSLDILLDKTANSLIQSYAKRKFNFSISDNHAGGTVVRIGK